jgi:hypothetical protein
MKNFGYITGDQDILAQYPVDFDSFKSMELAGQDLSVLRSRVWNVIFMDTGKHMIHLIGMNWSNALCIGAVLVWDKEKGHDASKVRLEGLPTTCPEGI